MSHKERSRLGQWAGLAAVVILLALCLIFLGGQTAAAEKGPPPQQPAFSPPQVARPSTQAPEAGPRSVQGLQQVNPGFTVDLTYDAVWGLVNPGDLVTMTRTAGGAAYGAAEADAVGFFWTPLYDGSGNGQPVDVAGGNTIEVYVNGGLAATLSPKAISGQVDVLNDRVTGDVSGLTLGTVVTVTLGDFGRVIADEPQATDDVDAGGDYVADFGPIADIGPHEMAQVQYRDANGNTVQAYVYPSEVFRVAGWNGVEGYAAPGDQVIVTAYVTYPTDVRWDAQATADWPHGAYGVYAGDCGEIIEYGDVVEVDLGGGVVISVTAGYLEVRPDAATDEITGIAPADETVRGYVWDQFDGIYDEDTYVADGGGNYTLTLAADLQTAHWPYVAYADAEGDEVGYAAPPPHIRAYPPSAGLYAVADGPNQPVTYTLDTGTGTFTEYGWCGMQNTCDWVNFDSVEPGHVITAEFPGWMMGMTVADVSLEPDTTNDGATGNSDTPGRLDVSACQWRNGGYPTHGCAVTNTTVTSPWAVTFPGFDVRDGMSDFYAYQYDATEGHRTFVWRGNWETAYFQVEPPDGVGGVAPHADEVVTAWLYESDGTTLIASTSDDGDDDPWRFWLDLGEYGIEPGHWVTITSDSGWAAGLQVPTLTVEADDATDMIWGEGPKSLVMVEHGWNDGWDWDNRWVPVDGYALDRSFFGGDIQFGDDINTIYQAPNGDRVRTTFYWPQLRIDANYGHDWISGETLPGATVTVTVVGKATAIGQAHSNGEFGTWEWGWDPEHPNIEPGDVITASAAGLTTEIDPVGTIDGVLDMDADTVAGTVLAPWFTAVTVRCEVWEWGGPSIEITGVVANGGSFLCDFGAIGWDLQPGPDVAVRYLEPDGDSVINVAYSLDLFMHVNYGHDWVEGYYEAGHTLWLTVTESDGSTPKAWAELQTQEIPWWGGQTGFSTSLDEPWVPSQPDIQPGLPGDYVYGLLDNGYASTVIVGTISGDLDVDADTISGNIYAPWFTQTLNGNCGVWEENGPGEGFQVDPNGGGYSCDFGAMGWDLLPGHQVGVEYQEPDGDWVINIFEEPAPDMRVEKWTEGDEVAPGGPVVFSLRYRNEGDAEAATVVLTDTLPANTTYVTDTSGFPASVGGGQVTWTFGPVADGEEAQFQLLLTNTANITDGLHNEADIYTLYDFRDDNNHDETDVHVGEGEPNLYVNKHSDPGDPAQGQTMLWEIDYGNDGPVASGAVVLTDTLPQDTSIVSWYSEQGYGLWTDHSTADQLILETPTIPGHWGDRIYLRLLVNASSGTQLTNTVEISSANSYAWDMRDDVWVGDPRWNGSLDKNLDSGRLVPGGYVVYQLNVRNNGNMATQTWLTDTFPAGTSFDEAWIWTGTGEEPFPPTYVDDEIAVWDLGVMEPAAQFNIGLRLAVSGAIEPGTVLENCAEIAIDGDDGWPYDDAECVVEMIHDYGPNLRVDKNYQWEWEGQLLYDIYFQNLGSQRLEGVWITDTYPADTAFHDDWWVNHGTYFTLTHDAANRQLVFWAQEFNPGDTARVSFHVDLDTPGEQGLCFTNLVEAPIPDDVCPPDNTDVEVACTGPDVYVEKWLSGGEPGPGDIVTFTVEFGNQNRWPWDSDWEHGSHITETLPAEMTFITATVPWEPDQPWHPDDMFDNTIVWGWGPMGHENWWRFDLVVQISDTAKIGDVIVNTVKAHGDSPDDVDPNYDNNVFELPVTIAGYRCYLPLILKNCVP